MTAGHAQCDPGPRPRAADPRVRLFAGARGLAAAGRGEGAVRAGPERRPQLAGGPPRLCPQAPPPRPGSLAVRGRGTFLSSTRAVAHGPRGKGPGYSSEALIPGTDAVLPRWVSARHGAASRAREARPTGAGRGGGPGGGRGRLRPAPGRLGNAVRVAPAREAAGREVPPRGRKCAPRSRPRPRRRHGSAGAGGVSRVLLPKPGAGSPELELRARRTFGLRHVLFRGAVRPSGERRGPTPWGARSVRAAGGCARGTSSAAGSPGSLGPPGPGLAPHVTPPETQPPLQPSLGTVVVLTSLSFKGFAVWVWMKAVVTGASSFLCFLQNYLISLYWVSKKYHLHFGFGNRLFFSCLFYFYYYLCIYIFFEDLFIYLFIYP